MISSQNPQRRSLSAKIRKRPVSFGNPALGTYKGCVYTSDGPSANERTGERPLVESAQTVERMVAMVDVPPEQVPEGVLNLARSHRPYIDHVRIVIAEPLNLMSSMSSLPLSLKSGEALDGSVHSATRQVLSSPSTSAIESAASILAAESETLEKSVRRESFEMKRQQSQSRHSLVWPSTDNRPSNHDRTYLVLFHLLAEDDAICFVEDLHGKPYTSLDETVTCSVYHVIALEGENGVSLLNPMFAPSTKKAHGAMEILPSYSSTDDGSHTDTGNHIGDSPNCAVCLENMCLDPNSENKTPLLTTVCNHTFHLDCLLQCQDSPCPVCRYDHSGLNDTLSQCHVCGTTENNFVCLICGVVSCVGPTAAVAAARPGATSSAGRMPMDDKDSCGRTVGAAGAVDHGATESMIQKFYNSHAGRHYHDTLHAYALDTETQHVWDFAGQGYVHRLLPNKEDGKLVEVNDPNNTSSQERSLIPGLSDAQEGEVVHRKLEGFASQYYTLLKSQLEQQRTFYEGRLQEIRQEFTLKQSTMKNDKADLIVALKQERKQLSNRLMSIRRKNEKVTDDVAFLKNMNESLQANKAPLERKIKQAHRERIESREMIQKYLPALEEKVSKLMLQLEESLNAPSTPATASTKQNCRHGKRAAENRR